MTRSPAPLRLCLLPTEKLVPVLIAQKEGLFRSQGLEVHIDVVASARQRDALLLSGETDVALLNLVSVVLRIVGGHRLRVLTLVERATSERPMFGLVRRPPSKVMPTERRPSVGIASGTIVDFLADAMLASVAVADVQLVEVADIAQRARDVLDGTLTYAVLAEPFLSDSAQRGAAIIADDSVTVAPPPTLCVRYETACARADQIARFLVAYAEAAALANADGDRARAALATLDLPHDPSWSVPAFLVDEQPTQSEVQQVLDWARRRGLADHAPSASDLLAGLTPT